MGKLMWFDYLVFAGFAMIACGVPMVGIGWAAMRSYFRSLA